jgi:hypothetical protein
MPDSAGVSTPPSRVRDAVAVEALTFTAAPFTRCARQGVAQYIIPGHVPLAESVADTARAVILGARVAYVGTGWDDCRALARAPSHR